MMGCGVKFLPSLPVIERRRRYPGASALMIAPALNGILFGSLREPLALVKLLARAEWRSDSEVERPAGGDVGKAQVAFQCDGQQRPLRDLDLRK
jgi:hypothetical protein